MNNKVAVFNLSRISFDGDFYAQLDNILKHIRLSREQVRALRFLYEDIENALSVKWRGCKVYPFGSIVTGLGIKSSDADCYVEIPTSAYSGHYPKETIMFIKYLLNRQPNKFQNLFAITNAKVPIVKFTHVPIGIECDISCSGHLSVRNSHLVAFLLQSDPRILKLSLIIKYWTKVHKFTGTNLLSNYSLVLLIIFYLQVHGILPSVHWLQQEQWGCREIYDSWNIGYMTNPTQMPQTNNTLPLHKLLGGFFGYYCQFDFEHYVISPFLGEVVPKSAFEHESLLPKSFDLYAKNVYRTKTLSGLRTQTEICAQDPFIHNRNCSVAVSRRLMGQILRFFNLAKELYDKCDRENNFNSFLPDLLKKKPEGLVDFVPVPKQYRKNPPNRRAPNKARSALRVATWKKKMEEIRNKQQQS